MPAPVKAVQAERELLRLEGIGVRLGGREITSVLARLAREQQIAVLISAHDMNPLLRETDTVVYVAAGRAAAGRTDDVIRTEVLSALYGSHVDVLHVHGRVLVVAGGEPEQAHHPLEADPVAVSRAAAEGGA